MPLNCDTFRILLSFLQVFPMHFGIIFFVFLFGNSLNFRKRLSESIYLFFNNKRRYFAMQVATLPRKLAVDS
jgi:hypothetical protein